MSLAADASLERSRAYCEQLTRQAARNFYYGLRLQAEPRRSAMFTLYAYMRLVDDISDEGADLASKQRGLAKCFQAVAESHGANLECHSL